MTRRVSEHRSHGRRYRVSEYPSGPPMVERREHDGWCVLDDREAAAVVDRLRRGEQRSARPDDQQQ